MLFINTSFLAALVFESDAGEAIRLYDIANNQKAFVIRNDQWRTATATGVRAQPESMVDPMRTRV